MTVQLRANLYQNSSWKKIVSVSSDGVRDFSQLKDLKSVAVPKLEEGKVPASVISQIVRSQAERDYEPMISIASKYANVEHYREMQSWYEGRLRSPEFGDTINSLMFGISDSRAAVDNALREASEELKFALENTYAERPDLKEILIEGVLGINSSEDAAKVQAHFLSLSKGG